MRSVETMDSSPEAARAVLHGLYGWTGWEGRPGHGELIEVSIKSPRAKWHAQHWDLETLLNPETVKQLAWWSTQGREVYMGCVGLTARPEPSPGHTHPRGGTALRGHTGALWLDVDCEAPGRDGPEFFTTVAEAVEIVDLCLGDVLAEAALVIGSGWGVQYWIPLYEPVPGQDASRVVRALVGWVGEQSARQIDRVWDVTRVMRMPGTLNWRAGPEDEDARPTGVLRWPDENRVGLGRLGLQNVIDALGDVVSDVLDVPRLDPELDTSGPTGLLDALLERYAPGSGVMSGSYEPDSVVNWTALGDVPGDLDRIADTVLSWSEVLEPYGWQCVSGRDPAGREREQVWERPGKDGDGVRADEARDRSAVVYADKPTLLVVYSDSPACGFGPGLRGSGRRGDAAGVGVISKWRAWVDLAWAGDQREARRCVYAGGRGDAVAERLAKAWNGETSWMEEWGRARELEALDDPFTTTMRGEQDP